MEHTPSLQDLLGSLPRPKWGSYDLIWSGGGEERAETVGMDVDAAAAMWGEVPEGPAKAWYEAQGWTVRGGRMYGCDFTLYRGSPEDFHSEYAVLVTQKADPPSWVRIHGLVRLVEGVRKHLLVCVVDDAVEPVKISHFCLSRQIPGKEGGV